MGKGGINIARTIMSFWFNLPCYFVYFVKCVYINIRFEINAVLYIKIDFYGMKLIFAGS